MYTLIVVLLIIVSILLALSVLVQNSKGGGLASGLSGSNQVMGVRKTTDFLEKMTWGFAIALFALALIGNFALPKNSANGNSTSIIQEQIDNTAAPAASKAPAPAANQQPAAAPADSTK
jgi:preprotein translocase subunit SecG